MVQYARTGPALSTKHGLDIECSATCDREFTIAVHRNIVMSYGSSHMRCKTPSRHDVYTMSMSSQTALSTSTRWKSGLRWHTHGVNIMSAWCFASHVWATVGHHNVSVDCYSKLPVTGCRTFDVQTMFGWQGWSCPRVLYHAFQRRCACFSYDISSCNMIVLHTPSSNGRPSKQSSFGYSSTVVEGDKRCSGYVGFSLFTSSTTGQYLNNKGVDPNTWSRTLT